MSEKKEKYFIVDGKIEIRFGVSSMNEETAKKKAERIVKNLLKSEETGFGSSFHIERIKEIKVEG